MTRGLTILLLAMALAGAGCQWTSRFGSARDPFGPKAACALPPDSSKEEIVAYLNRNVLGEDGQPGLRGWKTENAKIRMHGLSADASLQVAAPRSLRLKVLQPLSNAAMLDVGSNPDLFWVWSKQAPEKVVLTCRHDEIAETATHLEMPLPVQPEWLMEVLGVMPLDPNEFRMEREGHGSPLVKLISECHGPTGEPMHRIIQVNACHGLVTLHELRNAEGRVIASASFSSHYRDPEARVVLVKQIRLELPQEKILLTLMLDRIQVNPPVTDDSVVFMTPQIPGHRMVNLAEVARSHRGQPSTQPPTQYADAADDFARAPRSGATPSSGQLEAPAWPPGSGAALPAGRPALGFEPDDSDATYAPQFTPPGDNFELPAAEGDSNFRPASKSFRGQSPESNVRAASPEQPGFWTRLKNVFTSTPASAAAPPAGYSSEASRSSWGRPRLGQE